MMCHLLLIQFFYHGPVLRQEGRGQGMAIHILHLHATSKLIRLFQLGHINMFQINHATKNN